MGSQQVTWVILAGLPGTGKSTLAGALAQRAGVAAAILDKDRVRAALFPDALTDYTREQDDLCMTAIYDAAAYLTRQGKTRLILLDGRTYSLRAQRETAIRAAESAGAQWRLIHVVCPDEVAEVRLSQQQAGHPAQNRTPELYRAMKARWEEIAEPHLVVEMTAEVEAAVAIVEPYLKKGV
ncbi:AAA family ATPase [Silvibacterium sp.]|uniref:AAA family ATPase n=1 Tax=Silvibacterium sp. TaxID=1964179 RepID=UPI0039E48CE8